MDMNNNFNRTPPYITPPDIKDVAASKLLGRGAGGGTGDAQEITLGSGLSMSGTTLSATGGGGGISEFTVDGGDSTTVFSGGGYLTVDFGGSV